MDITGFLSGVTSSITGKEGIPSTIGPSVVGEYFTDLATLTKTNVESLQSTVTGNTADITSLKANQTIVGIFQGKNLFNKDVPAANIGRILSSVTGNTAAGATYETSDYIDVSAFPSGQTFAGKSLSTGRGIRRRAFYTDKTEASYIPGSAYEPESFTEVKPAGAKYLRITILITSAPDFQLELGTGSTAYVPYNTVVTNVNGVPIKNSDKDVPVPVTTAIPPSVNLANPNDADVALGKFVAYANGSLTTNASYNATGYIPVVAGSAYTMSFKHQLAWYNASKVYVNGSNQTDTNKTQIAPSGATYLRCTVAVASWSTFQVEAGTAQTAYVPYSPASLQLTGLQTTDGLAKIVYPTYTGTTVTFDANVALLKTIYALVGQELNIYYDGFNTLPDYGAGMPSYAFNITCSKGISTYRSFQYTPTSGETGSYPITIDILDNYGAVLQSVSSTIVVVARALPATVKNILILGDSTWHNGGTDGVGAVATHTLGEIFTSIGGNVPVFFGQQQPAPYKNECRSARTYTSFASGATCYKISFSGATPGIDLSNLRNATYRYGASTNYLRLVEKWVINGDGTGYAIGYNDSSGAWTAPTVFPATMNKTTTGVEAAPFPSTLTVTGVDVLSNFSILKDNEGLGNLNIDYYVQTVLGKPSGTTIDVVSIDLGINDTSSPNAVISTIMSSAKSLVAAFKAHNPSIKIIICYPKSRSSDNFSTTRKKIKYTMQALRKALLAEFDGNPANPNVYVTHSGAAIDRFYGYQMTTTATSGARYTDTSFQFNATGNDVHPGNEGNQQIGDAVSGCYIVALN